MNACGGRRRSAAMNACITTTPGTPDASCPACRSSAMRAAPGLLPSERDVRGQLLRGDAGLRRSDVRSAACGQAFPAAATAARRPTARADRHGDRATRVRPTRAGDTARRRHAVPATRRPGDTRPRRPPVPATRATGDTGHRRHWSRRHRHRRRSGRRAHRLIQPARTSFVQAR